MNRISTLKHLPEVGGFEHQGTHIHHSDTQRKAAEWLKKHNADRPNVWHSHPNCARANRIAAFRARALQLEAKR